MMADFDSLMKQTKELRNKFQRPKLTSLLQNAAASRANAEAADSDRERKKKNGYEPAFKHCMGELSNPTPPTLGRGRGIHLLSALETTSTVGQSVGATSQLDPDEAAVRVVEVKPPEQRDCRGVYGDYDFGQFRSVQAQGLPIARCRDQIIQALNMHQVVLIQGSTGCGKSTQVPQFILDDAVLHQRERVNIVVTQPRRIAALSLADRVSKERGWSLGSVVGYQVGLQKNLCQDTLIQYVTTGVLLERLIHKQPHLNEYTHVIIDEVHERDVDMDLCMLIVKEILLKNAHSTRIILMSATLATKKIATYFSSLVDNDMASIIEVDGRMFPVEEFYLEDMIDMGLGEFQNFPQEDDNAFPVLTPDKRRLIAELLIYFADEEMRVQGATDVSEVDCGAVLIFLAGLSDITDLNDYLVELRLQSSASGKRQGFETTAEWRQRVAKSWYILPLHSSIMEDEQRRIFHRPPPGMRKVILSTNIAESSITVPDIRYVIDSCMTKRLRHDRETNFSSLRPEWTSKTNSQQRQGRAGRVQSGRVYRLVYRDFHDTLQTYCPPEMVTGPLAPVILRIKEYGEDPRSLLSRALDPPAEEDIGYTMVLLKETCALTIRRDLPHPDEDRRVTYAMLASDHWAGELTFIGQVMARLPVDIHIGKLIALGYAFDVLQSATIVGACMSCSRNIFSSPFQGQKGAAEKDAPQQHLYAFEKRLKFSAAKSSDCIALLNAFKLWYRQMSTGRMSMREMKKWCDERYLDPRALKEVEQIYKDIMNRLRTSVNIATRDTHPETSTKFENDTDLNLFLLKIAIAGAFYPHYFIREHKPCAEEEAARMLYGKEPARCVQVGGLPMGEGHLYRQQLTNLFKGNCMKNLPGQPHIFAHDTKAVIQFPESATPANEVLSGQKAARHTLLAVYLALKMASLSRLKPVVHRVAVTQEAVTRLQELQRQQDLASRCLMHDPADENAPARRHVGFPDLHVHFIAVIPLYVPDCGRFFGVYQDYYKKLCEVRQAIQWACRTRMQPLQQPKLRQMCLARCINDCEIDEYARAKITGINQNKKRVEVFFVDIGSSSQLNVSELVVMPDAVESVSPHLAVECILAEIKPLTRTHINGCWSAEDKQFFRDTMMVKKPFICKIYSVVNSKIRIHLVEDSDEGVLLNNRLITQETAEFSEEPFTSRKDHTERLVACNREERNDCVKPKGLVLVGACTDDVLEDHAEQMDRMIDRMGSAGIVQDAGMGQKEQIRLTGPNHPHKMTFTGITKNTLTKSVHISPESVNCVIVDEEPQNHTDRVLVAGLVQWKASCDEDLVLRQTTLMPHLPGLPALLMLIFAPVVELRTDPDRTRVTGALCGLGYDTHGRAIHPANDIEMVADVRLDSFDVLLVNDIRYALNLCLGSGDLRLQGAKGLQNIQPKLREGINNLFFCKPRSLVRRHASTDRHQWQDLPSELYLDPGMMKSLHEMMQDMDLVRVVAHKFLYMPHYSVVGVGEGFWKRWLAGDHLGAEQAFTSVEEETNYHDWLPRHWKALNECLMELRRIRKMATDQDIGGLAICELCPAREKNVTAPYGYVCYNKTDLELHLDSKEHIQRVETML